MKKILLITILSLMSFMFLTDSVKAFEVKTFIPILRQTDEINENDMGTRTDGGMASCTDLDELQGWINNVLQFIKYAGVGLAVILTAVDFIQVVGGSKEDDLKKAFDRTVKRLIAVVLLLLTTVLVNFIIDIFINPIIDTEIENCLTK